MIESIEIKNFKSIKSKYFPLRNLNALLGLNGMGKSSFIQSLLAFRQSEKISEGIYKLNGKYVKIGTTKDALYQYAKKSPFTINLKFSEKNIIDFIFDYKIGADSFKVQDIDFFDLIGNAELEKAQLEEALFQDNFQYLNASRQDPESLMPRNYTEVVSHRNLGIKGEYTADYINAFGSEDVQIDDLLHPKSSVKDELTGNEMVVKSLINQVNHWMGEISPDVSIRTTEISSEMIMLEYEFKQPNLGNTNRFKPENVGFGITYSLPVVVAILKSKPGDLLIIENPESHIHPKGQAQLGKLMALAAMNGVQIIVETHSDHIINGIRVAVKKGDIDSDKTLIYYFEKVVQSDEQYSKITNIEIYPNGELSEYPVDMMDEWSNQLLKLI